MSSDDTDRVPVGSNSFDQNKGAREEAVVFDCEGENLVGIIHSPALPATCGIVTVVAGGPQYRAGVGRGLLSMGRELSALGIPVMRFDHRGLGDSSGDFRGFEDMGADLRAAIATFRAHQPQLEKIVLWGGCDAASAILIHAHQIPEVASIMVGNPWVTTTETQQAVARQHYLKRLGEWSFWRKLFTGKYRLTDYGKSAAGRLVSKLSPSPSPGSGQGSPGRNRPFVERMLEGLTGFSGPVLFVMSGQSLLSKEFDELIARFPAWKKAYDRPQNKRIDLPDADQAFSSEDSTERVNRAVYDWVKALD